MKTESVLNIIMRKILLPLCIFASVRAFAQTPTELDPVTITATRAAQKISETGRSITVIDGKMFRQLPVNSIDELLKYVPGVEVQSRGPMGAQSDIVIRGGTFQQVLVLLDGIKVNDPVTGHFSSYIPVAPSEIDRIEILRGPAAAVYGAEAVGGVINIITKTFNQYKKEKSTNTSIGMALGEYGFVNANAGFQTTGPTVNAALGILSNNTTGQLLRGRNRGYLHNHTFSGSIAFALKNNWQLSLRSSFDTRDFAAQNFYTTFKSDTATEQVKSWWNQLQLKQQTEKYSQQVDIMYKATNDHYLFNPLSIANNNKSGNFVVQWLRSQKVSQYFTVSMGTQLDRRSITSNDRGDHATHHGATFASLFFNKSNWKISPGLRLDWDENYGVVLLPQLNTSYNWKKFVVRANAGRAIRSADFTERFNNYNKPVVASGSIGNPNLGTENSWSYEAGADAFVSNHFKVSVTGFYRDQNNVIDYVTTPYADMPRKENLVPNGVYALAKNIKKVTTRGIETELVYRNQFNEDESLLVDAGITFLKSVSSDPVPSFYIISHARVLMQSNIIYTYKNISLAANFAYKKRDPQTASAINANISGHYFLLNAKLNYTIIKKINLFLAVNNITDIRYSDLLGSIMPRRWTTGGFSVHF
ncbi:MAG: TonB-dependent receptor plug [Ferruginibacter sp.]|nr:TonB-dependent receptor plug [Ferruginibacter sp.]